MPLNYPQFNPNTTNSSLYWSLTVKSRLYENHKITVSSTSIAIEETSKHPIYYIKTTKYSHTDVLVTISAKKFEKSYGGDDITYYCLVIFVKEQLSNTFELLKTTNKLYATKQYEHLIELLKVP